MKTLSLTTLIDFIGLYPDIPSGVMAKWIRNADGIDSLSSLEGKLSHKIKDAEDWGMIVKNTFVWAKTPEGSDFWSEQSKLNIKPKTK